MQVLNFGYELTLYHLILHHKTCFAALILQCITLDCNLVVDTKRQLLNIFRAKHR